MTGRFIVMEGGEGVGKSTQVDLLAQRLRAAGRAVDQTREPGGTPRGLEIREQLLHGDAVDPEAELGLFLEDRRIHVAERIRPNLARGMAVVCDRFSPSTIAYQGVARGMGVEYIEDRCREVTHGVEPDLVVVLDLPDEIAEARVGATRDRLERAGAEFHAAVRRAFRDLAPDRGWVIVDASGSAAEVAARVWAVVEPRL
jgi:dTMP kinase